jgi:hypothetical protein
MASVEAVPTRIAVVKQLHNDGSDGERGRASDYSASAHPEQPVRFVDAPAPIRRASLPRGAETVRALIDAGELYEGDIVQCGEGVTLTLRG